MSMPEQEKDPFRQKKLPRGVFFVPNMNKGTLALLFSIVLLGGGVALTASLQGGTLSPVLPSLEEKVQEKDRASETVPAVLEAEGERYEIEVIPGSTVYDLMVQAREETDFSFSGREFAGLGFFVQAINGKKQNPKEGMYWVYSLNGQKAHVGVSFYQLKANDVVSWTYEKEE